MKILLLAFNLQDDVFPLGLSYLKQYALKHHPDVEIGIKEFSFGNRYSYETNRNAEMQALSYIQLENPDVVAFSCYIWSGQTALDFAHAIKEISPHTKVILGGVEVSKNLLSDQVDFIIKGEGEIAFKEIIDFFKGQRAIEQVHNIMYLKDSQLTQNKQTIIENLDEIPFPYKHATKKKYALVRVETARGCLFNCNFCHYAKPKLRYFSIPYLKENLAYLFSNYKFKNLTFLDANFNSDVKRMFEVLDLVEENVQKTKQRINIHLELRPELITKDMVEKMEQYSFTIATELGFQSADREVLEFANRPTNLTKVKEALAYLDRSTIKYKIDLMYGLPKDTFFKFLKSTQFLLNNAKKQNKLVAHHYMILNNTTFYEKNSAQRFSKQNSSMVTKTDTQDALDLYYTKLFIDSINDELKFY